MFGWMRSVSSSWIEEWPMRRTLRRPLDTRRFRKLLRTALELGCLDGYRCEGLSMPNNNPVAVARHSDSRGLRFRHRTGLAACMLLGRIDHGSVVWRLKRILPG